MCHLGIGSAIPDYALESKRARRRYTVIGVRFLGLGWGARSDGSRNVAGPTM
jgi:hypothetical protein